MVESQIAEVSESIASEDKESIPEIKPGDDEVYVWCPKSSYFKRSLKKYGARKDVLKAAKAALQFHESEAQHLRKYMKRTFNQNRDEWMDDSSDSECEGCHPTKRQKLEDEQMKKE